jgi:hypothetical protein
MSDRAVGNAVINCSTSPISTSGGSARRNTDVRRIVHDSVIGEPAIALR